MADPLRYVAELAKNNYAAAAPYIDRYARENTYVAQVQIYHLPHATAR